MYVVAPQNRGWVLEGLCHDIDREFTGTSEFFYCSGRPPRADTFFFSHYSLFLMYADDPRIRAARSLVFFTHPSEPPIDDATCDVLNTADLVIAMSSTSASHLKAAGIDRRRITTQIPGVQPSRFWPHPRLGGGVVGFSSAYYPRKRPEAVVEIARLRPALRFRLLGRNWHEWEGFSSLTDTPNLEYLESELADYPDFYSSLDVFVSPSRLEGGPLPLLEAMMCNVVPVASRTGFAEDIISHSVNGFLVDVDAPADEYASRVDEALRSVADVRQSVVHITTAAFARRVIDLL